ncbi:hypothetical protein D9757_001729 [Collybiopsis confluens]|uniref:DNA2/NAM7 helicase-like C-terminal domain-containing protein n=1 Tax=Collybiopsis confluens TaxID=2823264 RepID=A0A8H5HYU1_9AGAR|nr:hypothetical protein D9757_001729 [Collybiopsis confluens]
MPPLAIDINQTLLIGHEDYSHLNTNGSQIKVLVIDESNLTLGAVKAFRESDKPLGISAGLDPKDKSILALAICGGLESNKNRHRCLIIEFPTLLGRKPTGGGGSRSHTFHEPETTIVRTMIESILTRPQIGFYAFDLAPLALALYRDLGIRLAMGVDIQSACPDANRLPREVVADLIGRSNTQISLAAPDTFADIFEDRTYTRRGDSRSVTSHRNVIVQQAWISQFVSGFENAEQQFSTVPKIDTTDEKFSSRKLDIMAKWAADTLRLHYLKPLEMEHDAVINSAGSIEAKSQVYKNKLRTNQRIEVKFQTGHGGSFTLDGHTGWAKGRQVPLDLSHKFSSGSNFQAYGKVTSRGRDGPTAAEAKKEGLILKVLQGKVDTLFNNPWVTNFWDPPNGCMIWPKQGPKSRPRSLSVSETPKRPLNASQLSAIQKMLSLDEQDHIVLIRGPPGSGKTSVISRFVEIATASNQFPGIWLIAQSNVAVKNIAEKLASIDFMDWRLLISNDFHYDWHEHLYTNNIQEKLILSDEFKTLPLSRYNGCHVILCTLSMLSNKFISKFLRTCPIHTLVIDEASQIEIGEYLPVFALASSTLQKMCLIGDDKQLPPHGQEDLKDLKSVFELEHFSNQHLHLLDTQYRMPPQMGDFISEAIYSGLLKSNAHHPITEATIACRLVDIPGTEEMEGNSFINSNEALAVVKLADYLQKAGKKYRIVTPYDSQRNYIEIF